ncbi:MAG TPA: GtrA family protein [Bacteroidia bacterium]|nr:GtrA family protein [Bacteroidia bacterium]
MSLLKNRPLIHIARKYIQNRRLKKLIKFGVVGATAFMASYLMYILLCKSFLSFGHQLDEIFLSVLPFYILFSVVGDITGIAVGYPINKKWTFKTQVDHSRNYFIGYAMVYVFSFLLNQFILYALVEWCRAYPYISDPFISKIIATGFSASTNFAGTNFLVFQKRYVQ